jgi:hypothetical protein
MTVSVAAHAQTVPATLTQQGRLSNAADGSPITGTVKMTFTLYNSTTGASSLWSEQQVVSLDSGAFSVQLGSVQSFPATLWNGATLYLGIQVNSDPEMTPREQITSVPYSLLANNATRASVADNASQLGGVAPSGYVTTTGDQTIAGNKTFSGPITGNLNGLLNGFKVYAGDRRFQGYAPADACWANISAASPCTVDISAGHFSFAPYCTVGVKDIDAGGYAHTAILQGTSSTTLSVFYDKALQSTGIGAFWVTYVCIGN